MNPYFKMDVINNFYRNLSFTNFESIDEERLKELDKLVLIYRSLFTSQTVGLLSLMTYTAERLNASYRNYGLRNGDEKAYFYMKVVDPNLQFLEVYESANRVEDVKELCKLNFRIHDKFLIFLEKTYNNKFHEYDPDDLWTRDSIKRQ